MTRPPVFAVVAPLPPLEGRGSQRVARASFHARLALAASAELSGCPVRDFRKDAEDVPQPTRGWHWSVSHSRAHVAGCVHRAPVGIDVEDRRHVRREVVERALAAQELALLGSGGADDFLRAWTAKEALLKELGLGLAGLSRCTIVEVAGEDALVVAFDALRRRVRQLVEPDHVVSASVGDGCDLAWVALAEPLLESAGGST